MNSPTREKLLEAWLRATVGPGCSVELLAGDASFRRYLRVRSPRFQGTRVVMDAPPGVEDVRRFVEIAARLSSAGILVPRVEAIDVDRGFLLLSDLGDGIYLELLRSGRPETLYERAIEELVSMQVGVSTAGLPSYQVRSLRTETMLFVDWFIARHLQRKLSAMETKLLGEVFSVLEVAALEQPQRFVHRDYHSRNLLEVDGRVGVLDFQDALRGPISYDLVSLLRDVYIEWSDIEVERWVSRYYEEALAGGILDVGRSVFARWFDLMGVQRHLKIAGIFARLFYRDGKVAYLADLPLTMRYLSKVVPRYPELEPLKCLLDDLSNSYTDRQLVRGIGR